MSASNSACVIAPAVEELLGLVDLRRRAATGRRLAHVGVPLLLLRPRVLQIALRHPDVLRDQVDEHAEERQQDREDDPAGLAQAGESWRRKMSANTVNSSQIHRIHTKKMTIVHIRSRNG